jgi:transcriptional regulator with XRE-family HTH domain
VGKVKTNLKTRRATHIRAWRKERGLTLERLADRIGVTPGALSQLERGDVAYTQPMLEALAEALACEPSDLISRPPGTESGLQLVWSQIPIEDRAKALDVLKAFAKKEKAASA